MSAWALFAAILGARLVGDLVVWLASPTPPPAAPAPVRPLPRKRSKLEGNSAA